MSRDGKVVHNLFGKWTEALYCGAGRNQKCIWRPGKHYKKYKKNTLFHKCIEYSHPEMDILSFQSNIWVMLWYSNGINSKNFSNKCKQLLIYVITISGTMPEDYDLYYGFTRFAMELNEIDPELEKILPPTDTRFRPDQRFVPASS